MDLGDHRRVLVVDDDPHVRQVARLVLQLGDFEVGEAVDGLDAVSRASEDVPDVIVLDEQMPGRSGSETADILRALLPDVLIVAFSAILDAPPGWADAFCRKTDVADIGLVVENVLAS